MATGIPPGTCTTATATLTTDTRILGTAIRTGTLTMDTAMRIFTVGTRTPVVGTAILTGIFMRTFSIGTGTPITGTATRMATSREFTRMLTIGTRMKIFTMGMRIPITGTATPMPMQILTSRSTATCVGAAVPARLNPPVAPRSHRRGERGWSPCSCGPT